MFNKNTIELNERITELTMDCERLEMKLETERKIHEKDLNLLRQEIKQQFELNALNEKRLIEIDENKTAMANTWKDLYQKSQIKQIKGSVNNKTVIKAETVNIDDLTSDKGEDNE